MFQSNSICLNPDLPFPCSVNINSSDIVYVLQSISELFGYLSDGIGRIVSSESNLTDWINFTHVDTINHRIKGIRRKIGDFPQLSYQVIERIVWINFRVKDNPNSSPAFFSSRADIIYTIEIGYLILYFFYDQLFYFFRRNAGIKNNNNGASKINLRHLFFREHDHRKNPDHKNEDNN